MSWNLHSGLIFTYSKGGQWKRWNSTCTPVGKTGPIHNITITHLCSSGFRTTLDIKRKTLFQQIGGWCSTPDALNNAFQRADLLEQKQSISNLESSQITTSVAKASWLQGMFDLFFKILRHEIRDQAFVFRFIRSLQNLIPKHKCPRDNQNTVGWRSFLLYGHNRVALGIGQCPRQLDFGT